ncbi:MAG: amidohydrolase family protein [Deltaproteobacteria bacterium]|nr:amidohydrolase family protein [Deltaproteobacteria bacterium]
MSRIIDFHGHCGIQHNTNYRPDEIRRFLAGSPVARILISSLSATVSREYAERDLLELRDESRVVPLYWVNPYLAEWREHLDALRRQLPIPGLKLHPTANIYEIETEFLRPVFAHCRAEGLFLAVHTDTHRSSPERLTELVLDFPDVDVVLIHMDNPVNSIFLAKRCPNVYLETSWVERKWANLAPVKLALDSVAPHKILFGTDFPYEFPLPGHLDGIGRARSYDEIIHLYRELLPAAAAERILYANARDLLRRHGVALPSESDGQGDGE